MKESKVISLGFEGPNRAGKGTQIELMESKLRELEIPYLVVRGDGSRPNEGSHEGDPISEWWTEILPRLKDPANKDSDLWNISSMRLARELVVFRDRVLPKIAEKNKKPLAVLLVDRTLLSRTMVPRSQGVFDIPKNLYPPNSKFEVQDICPDIIFNIIVGKKDLLERLDPNDPKYEFRKKLILEKYSWYLDAHKYLPHDLQDRVVPVDGTLTSREVHESIVNMINKKFPDLIKNT